MSAWIDGKLDLTCSLDVLKRALAGLMPQWASHIKVDPNGKLSLYRYHGAGSDPEDRRRKDVNVHVVIPGSGHPGSATPPGRDADNDWGFRLGKDGKWETVWADHNSDQAANLANEIRAEVIKMRMEAVAKLKGFSVDVNQKTGNKVHMEMKVSKEIAKMLQELA